MKRIAKVHSDFPTKFGIPRQSGRVEELKARVVFEPEYRDPQAFRGLEEFTHIWLLWEFSEVRDRPWSPTVRPPRLGGNVRMGVFATRSPFRPNPIGLSCVRLERIQFHPTLGPVLHIAGADLMDGTPVYDIKPYLPGTDSHPQASSGFAGKGADHRLEVIFPEPWLQMIPEEKRHALLAVLAEDPRPAYQHDPGRVYGMPFAGRDIHFTVEGDVLTVCEVVRTDIKNPGDTNQTVR
ncbi:MAG: tRNA (N6-threonylcarbamoyladenosine(37)-N6)-methyltransferase TrmO [Clostridiales bacterium]|nr:tRNA (N6-threonylcarbamoyladenosine(37)-N6)-methyltransferase TrmO [Clostridiales bacterium]